MAIKEADDKGRVTLGKRFAGATLIVEEVDEDTIVLRRGVTIPSSELWLHRNPKAKQLVQVGLRQAQAGEFSKRPPKPKAKAGWIDDLAD